MRKVQIFMCSLLLSGCAMTPAGYDKVGNNLAMLQQCFVKGYISSDIAATGKYLVQRYVSDYTYNSSQINSTTAQYLPRYSDISQNACSAMEVSIKEAYLNQQNQQQSIPTYQQPRPTSTTCYRVGYMVQCNSY